MGADIGSGSVCFGFHSTHVVQLSLLLPNDLICMANIVCNKKHLFFQVKIRENMLKKPLIRSV